MIEGMHACREWELARAKERETPVEQVSDREELRRFLMHDRLANVYLLGNLDPAYFPFCRWFGMRRDDGELGSLILFYNGLSLPVLFMVGTEPNFEALLEECKGMLPKRFHFHVQEEQIDVVDRLYAPTESKRMFRMGLERSQYAALKSHRPPARELPVERLGHRDTAAIMELYEHYPDNLFEPYQLETGLYFGVRDEELGLSSIAGIHVVSDEHDVAVIGNFVTHPERRGLGLATACTDRLLEDLFERVSFVALNVQEDNAPAIQMYTNFGFEKNNLFYEGRCETV